MHAYSNYFVYLLEPGHYSNSFDFMSCPRVVCASCCCFYWFRGLFVLPAPCGGPARSHTHTHTFTCVPASAVPVCVRFCHICVNFHLPYCAICPDLWRQLETIFFLAFVFPLPLTQPLLAPLSQLFVLAFAYGQNRSVEGSSVGLVGLMATYRHNL